MSNNQVYMLQFEKPPVGCHEWVAVTDPDDFRILAEMHCARSTRVVVVDDPQHIAPAHEVRQLINSGKRIFKCLATQARDKSGQPIVDVCTEEVDWSYYAERWDVVKRRDYTPLSKVRRNVVMSMVIIAGSPEEATTLAQSEGLWLAHNRFWLLSDRGRASAADMRMHNIRKALDNSKTILEAMTKLYAITDSGYTLLQELKKEAGCTQ